MTRSPVPVADVSRSTKLRAERGRLKSCKDDERIAQAQRGTSAGLGLGYYLAAPSGAPEATGKTGDAEDLVVAGRTVGFRPAGFRLADCPARSARPA